ncbi:MAG: sulfatase [Planctomycetales bacterium]
MRTFCVGLIAICILNIPVARAAERPNIVLIIADDLGERDVACYGGDLVETPQIDRLAKDGARFRQAYAPAPVCTPTRAALMTGQAPARLQITIWSEGSKRESKTERLLQAKSRHDLPLEAVTVAERLQQAGYLTAAVGKWHLGDADHAPETQGFDINIGGTHWGAPATFFWPYRGMSKAGGEFRYVPHLEFGKRGEYLTDRLTQEAIRILKQAPRTQPFFLYLAHYAPHTPMQAKSADVEHFQKKITPATRHRNATYAAMVKSVDDSVGAVRQTLQELGLDKNTIVIFTSDNGGYLGIDRYNPEHVPVTDNWPHRSGKGSLYEGGLRIPLIVSWPGVTTPGSEPAEPVILTDLFPTLLAAAGLNPDSQTPADGVSLVPVLKEAPTKIAREDLYFHYPHYYPTTQPVSAIRSGDWKLLQYLERGDVELYNLRTDPSETANLAEAEPKRTAELLSKLEDWRKEMQAAMPARNPDYRAAPDLSAK